VGIYTAVEFSGQGEITAVYQGARRSSRLIHVLVIIMRQRTEESLIDNSWTDLMLLNVVSNIGISLMWGSQFHNGKHW
jgi:hypothetical protein